MEAEQITETEKDGKKRVKQKKADDREFWSGRFDFVMSALSLAVGMGNVWRFPYMCYRNGGGAFLVPYLFMVAITGYPLVFLEFAFGQYGSSGIVTIWDACPLFQGIGWTMNIISFTLTIYYNMLIAYTLYYIFASFTTSLPWKYCGNPWNTKYCTSAECIQGNITASGATCFNRGNDTSLFKTPAEEYFNRELLGITSGLTDLGGIRWKLLLCYLLCWLIVVLCLSKGIKSLGKAAHVTTMLPYLLITILFFRAITLKGSGDGIRYFLTPTWDRMMRINVWCDALVQVFFSMSISMGGLITLSSYNRFNNNFYRDAIVVTLGDTCTSVYVGLVIFGILGFLAHDVGTTVDQVASQGAGLAFVVYPSAVTRLPLAPLWSIIFMLMLMNLGMGSMITLVTTVHTTLLDMFPNRLRHGRRPFLLVLMLCLVPFLLGVIMTTDGGMYVVQLMDAYVSSYGLLIGGLAETVVLCWVYGIDNLFDDIQRMLGNRPGLFTYYSLKFVAPIMILSIVIVQFAGIQKLVYGDYTYPVWADILGWLFVVFEVGFIPGIAVYSAVKMKSDLPLIEKIRSLSRPTESWRKHADRPNVVFEPQASSKQVEAADNQQEEATKEVSKDVVTPESRLSYGGLPNQAPITPGSTDTPVPPVDGE